VTFLAPLALVLEANSHPVRLHLSAFRNDFPHEGDPIFFFPRKQSGPRLLGDLNTVALTSALHSRCGIHRVTGKRDRRAEHPAVTGPLYKPRIDRSAVSGQEQPQAYELGNSCGYHGRERSEP
jgi:hypothetical protein